MSKIGIIIQREYLTRVRNKTFILSTFLLPIMMILFIVGSAFFAAKSFEKQKVAVVNDPGYFKKHLKSDSNTIVFEFASGIDSNNYVAKGYDGILYLPQEEGRTNYELRSKKQFGLSSKGHIEKQLNKAIENHLLEQKGIDKSTLDSITAVSDNAVMLNNKVTDGEGVSKQANAGLAYGIGFGSGILIYITMFIFGAMVMRGVAEEKMNRIAEVIVSSCKPFELMLGKIIGIAGVGLTQFMLWIILIFILMTAMQLFIPAETLEQFQQMQRDQQQLPGGPNSNMALKILEAKTQIVEGVNWPLVIFCFLFYFLGGYLFYASLFAAIGSVINEDPQEAQALMLADHHAHHLCLHHTYKQPEQSQQSYGRLGKYHTVHFANRYDGTYSLWRSGYRTLLATWFIDDKPYRRIPLHYLVCRKGIPHRYPDVWQKSILEGNG